MSSLQSLEDRISHKSIALAAKAKSIGILRDQLATQWDLPRIVKAMAVAFVGGAAVSKPLNPNSKASRAIHFAKGMILRDIIRTAQLALGVGSGVAIAKLKNYLRQRQIAMFEFQTEVTPSAQAPVGIHKL